MQDYLAATAWGAGYATVTEAGQVLDVWYPPGRLGLGGAPADLPAAALATGEGNLPGLRVTAAATVIDSLGDPPVDAADVYLRLHLLSHRLMRPHHAHLDRVV